MIPFDPTDPFRLDDQLTEDERMIRESAHAFAQSELQPRVIDAFREVQAAQQERDRLEKEADAYANRVLAQARGDAAATLEQAEGYRAEAVNNAQGEAARFNSIYEEYIKAPEVTRRRMYLETMENVLGSVDKVIIGEGIGGGANGSGVVPYLPLDQLRRPSGSGSGSGNGASQTDNTNRSNMTTGGNN